MRVTHTMRFNMSLANINRQSTRLFNAQNQAASGKRVSRPSDDPIAAQHILDLRQRLDALTQFKQIRDQMNGSLSVTENALQDIESVVMRAHEISIAATNDTTTQYFRDIMAGEVEQLIGQTIQLGNTDLSGQYIFAGYASDQPPFSPEGLFVGESSQIKLPLDAHQSLASNIVGSEFLASDLRPFIDATTPLSSLHRGQGITPGSIQITDRVGNIAIVDLSTAATITDVITAISNAGGINITAAINATGDGLVIRDDNTIPTRNLTISEWGGGTTARDLGIAANRPGSIDGTPLQPALSTLTPITSLYGKTGVNLSTIRITNGLNEADVDLSTAQTVGDVFTAINNSGTSVVAQLNANGTAINVQSTDASTTAIVKDINGGTAAADLGIQGGRDIIKMLQLLHEALKKNDQIALGNLIEPINTGLEQLLAVRGEVGARMTRIEFVDTYHADLQVTLASALSSNEDIEATEAFSRLTQQATAFQAALGAAAQAAQPTLMDFLR